MRTQALFALLLATFTATGVTGCGGGGGGGSSSGDYSGAASVSIRVAPSTIDSGDRAQVTVSIGDVHENGVALKFRYPEGLEYVPSSAFLTIDEKEIDISPSVNVLSSEDEAIYLIFYLPQKLFRTVGEEYYGDPGDISFELAGKSAVRDGLVEVDPDVDDPNIPDDKEFDLSNPEFLAEDEAPISVVVGR